MSTAQYRIEKHQYGWLIFGDKIPVNEYAELCKLAGDGSVISPGIASAMKAHTALCANNQDEQAWRDEIEASLTAHGMIYTPLTWLNGTDTGLSSRAIYAVMMDCVNSFGRRYGDTPSDSDDFGRCYRLLQKFPDWIPRLPEVAKAYPKTAWPAIVDVWDKLTEWYEAKNTDAIYELLNTIHRAFYEKQEADRRAASASF